MYNGWIEVVLICGTLIKLRLSQTLQVTGIQLVSAS
jgi:hypothetical protein